MAAPRHKGHKGHRRHGRKRPHRQSKGTLSAQERNLARAPHSFVFARPGCGRLVKALALDLRHVFEPFTASQLRVSRRNVIKDFVAIAGPLHVSHILYFTHPKPEELAAKRRRYASNLEARKKQKLNADSRIEEENEQNDDGASEEVPVGSSGGGGGVYMHLIRTPSGPSVTFRVGEYCLTRDIFTLVRKVFDVRQFSSPPLLAMTGFGAGSNQHPPPHLRLLVDMFQNLLPTLNVQKLKVSSVRRVLLLSREVDGSANDGEGGEVIYLRHYNIRLENRSISRALRRLGMGGAAMKRQKSSAGLGPQGTGKSTGVPSFAKYASIGDYLTKGSLLTDSAASEVEDMAEVQLPGQAMEKDGEEAGGEGVSSKPQLKSKDIKEAWAQAKATHGFIHLSGCRRACVRLTEIGPRLTLQLIKIEEGVNSGTVLYHSWQKRTPQEVAQQEAEFRARKALRAQRRAEHEKRRKEKEAAKTNLGAPKTPKKFVQIAQEDDEEDKGKIHQLSDAEEIEAGSAGSEDGKKSGSAPKPIKKRKSKKISKKHPAFNYLMEKAKERKLAQKMHRSRL